MFTIRNTIKKIYLALINSIYPPKCMVCKQNVSDDDHFCSICWPKIEFISEPFCKICGLPQAVEYLVFECQSCQSLKPKFDLSKSVFRYNWITRKMIKNFKFYGKTYYSKNFAQLIFKSCKELVNSCDYIIPVPMHDNDLHNRGFNQTLLIAISLAQISNKPLLKNTLLKIKQSEAQSTLSRKERLENLKNVFAVNSKHYLLKDKNVVIIDDVMTTGATLNECAKVLKKAGVKKVITLSIARSY